MDISELKTFIFKASRATYASGDQSILTKEPNKSTTIEFKDGNWTYHDNYFGGEPYAGREVVFYKNNPVFVMLYYGSVSKNFKDINALYSFLQAALRKNTQDLPYRGPKEYKEEEFTYNFKFSGDIQEFEGIEKIYYKNKQVYKATFIGGLVDMRS